MNLGRMPACIGKKPFDRIDTSALDTTLTGDDVISINSDVQAVFGNKCGHNKNKPRVFQEKKGHKSRPYLFREARKRLRSLYYNPFKYNAGKMAFHLKKFKKNGELKRIRSESRESITHTVGEALMHYCNIEHMAIGFMDVKSGKFVNIGISKLAKITYSSYQSVRKALRAFEEAGYITIQQSKRINKDGNLRNNEAFITVSKQFFYSLGFDEIDILNYKSKQKADHRKKIIEQGRLNFNQKKRVDREAQKKLRQDRKDPAYLDKELPGWQRLAERTTSYVDYTGCSKRGLPKPQNSPAVQSSDTTLSLSSSPQFKALLAKLRRT